MAWLEDEDVSWTAQSPPRPMSGSTKRPLSASGGEGAGRVGGSRSSTPASNSAGIPSSSNPNDSVRPPSAQKGGEGRPPTAGSSRPASAAIPSSNNRAASAGNRRPGSGRPGSGQSVTAAASGHRPGSAQRRANQEEDEEVGIYEDEGDDETLSTVWSATDGARGKEEEGETSKRSEGDGERDKENEDRESLNDLSHISSSPPSDMNGDNSAKERHHSEPAASDQAKKSDKDKQKNRPRPAIRLAYPEDAEVQPILRSDTPGSKGAEEANKKAQMRYMKVTGMISPLLPSPHPAATVTRKQLDMSGGSTTPNHTTHTLGGGSPLAGSLRRSQSRQHKKRSSVGSDNSGIRDEKAGNRTSGGLHNESSLFKKSTTAASPPIPMHGGGTMRRKINESPVLREHRKHMERLWRKNPEAYFREIGTLPINFESQRSKLMTEQRKDRPSKVPINIAGTASRNTTFASRTVSPGPAYALPSVCFDTSGRAPGCKIGKPFLNKQKSITTAAGEGGDSTGAQSLDTLRKATPSPLDYEPEKLWQYGTARNCPNSVFGRAPRWREEKKIRLSDIHLSAAGEEKLNEKMKAKGLSSSGIGTGQPLGTGSRLKDWYEEEDT